MHHRQSLMTIIVDIVKLLIQNGANVNAQDRDGCTALHEASEVRNYKIVKVLLSHGADVNVSDRRGDTPLRMATLERYSDKKLIKELLAHHADSNAQSQFGISALHFATQNSDKEVIKLLLAAGANINIQTNDGETPLHWAAQRGDDDMVKLLLVNKADANIQDSYQRTALHYAVESGNTITVNVLLLHGADMQREDRDGMTPYMIAQEEDIKEVISELEFWYKYKNNVPTTLKRTFEYVDNTSNKFWNVEVTGSSMTVTFGKSGTAGVTKTKEFKDEAEARKAAEKLIKEKTNKGYTEVLEF